MEDAARLTPDDLLGLSRDGCPMSLLADHRSVRFSYYRGGIGTVEAEMH